MTDADIKHTPLPHHDWSWRKGAWRAYRELLQRSSWPILVGPWRGEIGFEVLYWIPFIEKLKALGIAPERLIPISRGGASAWYGCPAGLELFAMRTPQAVRIQNRLQVDQSGLLKQIVVDPFDRQVLRDAAETLKLGAKYHVLHPAWMYHILADYWTGRVGPMWLIKRTNFPTIPAPDVPQMANLPEVYVAAKFYARETWNPNDRQVKSATAAILERLANQSPVVVLNSGVIADEHMDFPVPKHPNLFKLTDLIPMRAETNLMVQSAVMARAQGFVGTYGGAAQLALRMGKPSVNFYAQWAGTAITHAALSNLIAIQQNVAFHTVKVSEIPMLLSVLPAAEIRQVGKQLDTRVPATA